MKKIFLLVVFVITALAVLVFPDRPERRTAGRS